jgi:hypothetical protein
VKITNFWGFTPGFIEVVEFISALSGAVTVSAKWVQTHNGYQLVEHALSEPTVPIEITE